MFYENYYWGMNPIWWFLWLVLLIWIFATPYNIPGQRKKKNTPLDILHKRLASGQINNEQYQEIKRMIGGELPVKDI